MTPPGATAPAPTRRRLPRAEREQRMLDAAEAVFGEQGFRGASMERIAERSGVTKALVYQYFASKEGLYASCIERARARLFERIEAVAAAARSPRDRLASAVDVYFDEIDADRDRWYILYGDAPRQAVDAMRRRNAKVIVGLLEADLGEGRGQELELLAELIVGAGEQLGRWWLEHGEISKRQLKERFLAAMTGAIASTLRR
jgi:AcrR family transcriptional regulator